MELPPGWEQWEEWALSEREVRALWKLARLAEWSSWSPEWRQYRCPECGQPESLKRHADHCELLRTLRVVYSKYPQVIEPVKLDATEEIAAEEFFYKFVGKLDPKLRRAPNDPTPKEKGPDFSEPPPPEA